MRGHRSRSFSSCSKGSKCSLYQKELIYKQNATTNDKSPGDTNTSYDELNENLLPILGNDNLSNKSYDSDIHAAIAILKSGLSKETEKELYEKYPPPFKCRMLKAPILNDEVATGISSYITFVIIIKW